MNEKIAEGAGHCIYEDEDPRFLVKIPKPSHRTSFPIERVQKDIADMQEIFGTRLPSTTVEPDNRTGYRIRQRRVEKAAPLTLAHLEISDIRDEVESILQQNRDALSTKACGLDFIGLEGSAKCILSIAESMRGSLLDTLCMKPGLQIGSIVGQYTPIPFPAQSIDWWERGEVTPVISNLLHGTVDGQTNVFVTDISLVRPKDPEMRERMRSWILQTWNAYFLKKFFQLKL